ncbi:MAG: CopG family transcriptional regulator [Candidatus Competibacteraceae bacterium]
MDTVIEAKIPEQLAQQAQALVREGWVSDINSLIIDALRRYCESHQAELTEAFIREDVRWGLYGDD